MANVEVKAPSNIKISGEHSVVYDGPCLSAAIPIYATASVSDTETGELEVVLQDLGISASFTNAKLKELYREYGKRDISPKAPGDNTPTDLAKYIDGHRDVDKQILPYATIAARLLNEQGIDVLNKKITIHSDVPITKGYASSAVCSTSFTMGLIKSSGKSIDDQIAIDISRDGERIVHRAETAGRLDVGPVYFGGYVTFSKDEGIKQQDISTEINIVVIDTGQKPPTAQMVQKVRDRRATDQVGTDKILRDIDRCVLQGIKALREGDVEELGRQMSRNHELLKMLGVSSEGLDKATSIAVSNGAYGSKLCGGGGGGMGIALVKDDVTANTVIKALKENGFDAFETKVTLKGAKYYSGRKIRTKI
ncbi:MAG: mevalonate kinase [Candidatus Marsarchaeota archaeon]|jgi:mevalonate kinase|nr:mevalonate kinase [Candidatus Marsarchaeota archaeon]